MEICEAAVVFLMGLYESIGAFEDLRFVIVHRCDIVGIFSSSFQCRILEKVCVISVTACILHL